jgi:prophage maintenance system killer protein
MKSSKSEKYILPHDGLFSQHAQENFPSYASCDTEVFINYAKKWGQFRLAGENSIIFARKHHQSNRLDHVNSQFEYLMNIAEYMHCHPRKAYTLDQIIDTLTGALSNLLKGQPNDWYDYPNNFPHLKSCYVVSQRILEAETYTTIEKRTEIYQKALSNREISDHPGIRDHVVSKLKCQDWKPQRGDQHGIDTSLRQKFTPVAQIFSDSADITENLTSLFTEVQHKFQELAKYDPKEQLEKIICLAATLHNGLTTIHPFSDGNGKFARFCMWMLLQEAGYALTNQNRFHEVDSTTYDASVHDDFAETQADDKEIGEAAIEDNSQNRNAHLVNYLKRHQLIQREAENNTCVDQSETVFQKNGGF